MSSSIDLDRLKDDVDALPSIDLCLLKEEIDAEKRKISAITTQDYYSEEGRRKADLIKILAKKEEEHDLLLESLRVKAIACRHDRLFPPTTEDCPICLETVRIVHPTSVIHYPCCGKCICPGCSKRLHQKYDGKICPLCRAPLPNNEKSYLKRTKKHAKAGQLWAQMLLGCNLAVGDSHYPINKREAFRLLWPIAEEQKDSCIFYSDVLLKLWLLYREGIDGLLQPCLVTGTKYLLDAANRGHISAQFIFGQYNYLMGGDECMARAAYYWTLASSNGFPEGSQRLQEVQHSALGMLGKFHHLGLGGVGTSLYCAKEYLLKAAENGDHDSYYNLACALMGLCCYQYGGVGAGTDSNVPISGFSATLSYGGESSATLTFDPEVVGITGHSCIPRVLFWLRKSVSENTECNGGSESVKMIRFFEKQGKQACANCKKKAECFPQPLEACVRCKAVWYCGKE
ncbi:hypothetical protein ACHAWF_002348, partial [Thalassiosira exigua]